VPGNFVFREFGLANEEHVNMISVGTVNNGADRMKNAHERWSPARWGPSFPRRSGFLSGTCSVTANVEFADATHQLSFGALHGKRCFAFSSDSTIN
jgi:hypothetical protein